MSAQRSPAQARYSRTRSLHTRIVPLLVTIAIALSIGWAARAPYHPPNSDAALLRLSRREGKRKSDDQRRGA